MDPNQTWKDLVAWAEAVDRGEVDFGVPGEAERCADGMANLVVILRDWLAAGGFPPAAFTGKVKVGKHG